MTIHIKRVVAAMSALLMLMTLVPTAALPTIKLPMLSEKPVESTVPEDNAATDIPDVSVDVPDAPADNAIGAPVMPDAPADTPAVTPDAPADTPVVTPDAPVDTPAVTPDAPVDTPAVTPDAPAEEPVVLQPTDPIAPEVMMGPVKPEDVFTSDEGVVLGDDNTLYMDSDNDGEIEAIKGDAVSDDDFGDDDTSASDLFREMENSVTIGKDPVAPEADSSAVPEEDAVEGTQYFVTASGVDTTSGYQNNAYEPTNTNNEDHPFIPNGKAWIDLSKIKYGAPASPTYPFTAWSANTSFLNTSATAYDSDGRATAWLFPDKDLINSTIWSGSYYESAATSSVSGATGYAYNRYDAMQGKWGITLDKNVNYMQFSVGSANYNVNLSDTPYLCFSTEQEDDSQLAIAVRIGTPNTWNTSGTATAWNYRWYTITDNNIRPGLAIADMNHSMEPEVQIGKMDTTDIIVNDQAYVSGAMTGCIDMTAWLPIVNPTTVGDASDLYRVDTVRIYKKGTKAARVNYLYFLNQSAPILSPQAINADKDIATTASTQLTAPSSTTVNETKSISATADDKNGWLNGKAISAWRVTGNGYGGDINTGTASNFTYVTSSSKNYVTVIVPVRKWINVALDARRLAFTISCSAAAANCPVFSFYGNSVGFSDPDRNDSDGISLSDSLLAVIGGDNKDGSSSPYLVHKSSGGTIKAVKPGRIDADFSHHLDYNANSNWYDLLDNEGFRDKMVQSGTKAGWIYLSEIHIVVPTGVTFNLGQLSLGNNSDSLNAGHTSSAFDGGTGVQPNATIPTASPYQTVTNQAAAFGPMLETSKFGTFDMLERVSTGGQQVFYGRSYKTTASINAGWSPGATGAATIASDKYIIVYATCTVSGKSYGLTGLNSDCRPIWVPMASLSQASTKGEVYAAPSWTTSADILDAFANDNWLLSGFGCTYTATHVNRVADSGKVYYTAPDGTQLSSEWGHNGYTPIGGSYIRWGSNSANTYQESNTAIGIYSHVGMTRTFSNPLVLQKQSTANGYAGTAPHLRYHIAHSGEAVRAAVTVEVDGVMQYYYLAPQSNGTITLTTTATDFTADATYQGYLSLNSLVSLGTTVKLVGLSVHTNGVTGYLTFRNFEVLYERSGYEWYDELRLSGSNVIDNVDIISDAFHYSIADGQTALTGSGYDLVGNYGEKGWKIGSYNLDTANKTSATTDDATVNDYVIKYPQYRPQLDHLRIPLGAGYKGQIIFQADRSFPTSNFKYLYVSYSMADDDGVAAMDDSGAGVSIALHGVQDSDSGYYMEVSSGQPTQMKYATTISKTKYSSSVNAAVDLSKISGLTSINEICFYFYNPSTKPTDVYINYLFLSNTAPASFYQTAAARPYYHNYYLMDGSGDRYSCRFPTTSNPTGRITDSTNGNEAGRVNPLIIKRGDTFDMGTFYNGAPLAVPDKASSTAATSDDTASTITGTDGLKAIWFYDYSHSTLSESHNINEYYQIDAEKTTFNSDLTGGSVTFDALWNYNRWLTGWGLQRYLGYNKTAGTVEGTLLQLYATNNNVLLRTGLEPKKYQTIYNTHGGQMTYPGSSGIQVGASTDSGIIENVNNYYITQTVVLSYYTWPTEMGDKTAVVYPTKFGYTFNGWYTAETGGTRIYRYNTMSSPSAATLHAQWVSDGNNSTYTVYFQKRESTSSTYRWFTRKADRASEFKITIPWNTKIETTSGTVRLVGWKLRGDTSGKVYTPGTTLTITKTGLYFYPVTSTTAGTTATVTVSNGCELQLFQGGSTWKTITNGLMDIKVTTSGSGTSAVRTYSNIPLYTVVRTTPNASLAKGSYNWYLTDNGSSAYSTSGMVANVLISRNANYAFAVNADTKIIYAADTTTTLTAIHTSPKAVVSNRQMMFYSKVDTDAGTYNIVECGTIYTKDSQLDDMGLTSSSTASQIATKLAAQMQLVSATDRTPKYSTVRKLAATEWNDENQYYMMVTENKGNPVTYYARGYVVVQNKTDASKIYLYYSPVIAYASVGAA